jgi:hypothetical protein
VVRHLSGIAISQCSTVAIEYDSRARGLPYWFAHGMIVSALVKEEAYKFTQHVETAGLSAIPDSKKINRLIELPCHSID